MAQIFGLLGPNGAGKATTLRMMLDIIKPESGNIKVFGKLDNMGNEIPIKLDNMGNGIPIKLDNMGNEIPIKLDNMGNEI